MLTRENFKEAIREGVTPKDKKRILNSDKEFCVITTHTFNTGTVLTVSLTKNFRATEHPDYIFLTQEVQEILG